MARAKSSVLETSILTIFVFLPLVMTPHLTIDAVNLGKFFFFNLGSALSLFVLFNSRIGLFLDKRLVILTCLFTFGVLLPILFSGAPFQQQVIGTWGRNIGLLTYFASFITILFGIYASKRIPEKIVWLSLVASSLLSVSYGLLQSIGYDYIDWKVPAVFGSLGNLNFYSAHIAIIASLFIGYSMGISVSVKTRTLVLFLLALSGYLLQKANSTQGWISIFLTATLSIHILLSRRDSRLRFIVPSFTFFIATIMSFGFIGKGPLASIIDSQLFSIRIRMYFWEAALRMFRENLAFGVGLDSFEDWYREYRPLAAFLGGDFNEAADSAHNFLLDYAAVGGICFLFFGLFVVFLIIVSLIKIVRSSISKPESVSPESLSVAFGLLAFLIQSMISPQQIGILCWGFLFLGLTFGRVLFTGNSKNKVQIQKTRKVKMLNPLVAILSITLAVLAILPLIKEYDILSAQKSENLSQFIKSINTFPTSPYYYRNGISILDDAGYHEAAVDLGIVGIEEYPRNFLLTEEVIKLKSLDPRIRVKLETQLASLNTPR